MPPDTPAPERQPPGPQHPQAPGDASGRRDDHRGQAEAFMPAGSSADTRRLVCLECGTGLDSTRQAAGQSVRCLNCQAEMIVAADYDRKWDGSVSPTGGSGAAAARQEVSPVLDPRRRRRLARIAAAVVVGGLLWNWWGGWQRSVDAMVLRTLPRNTDAITSLTGAQAAALMRERGRTSWTLPQPGLRAYKTGFGWRVLAASTMSLDGLRTLPLDVASALVRQPQDVFVDALSLDGLTTVPTVDVMRVLAEFDGDLSLGGIRELVHDDAPAIARFRCRRLLLHGLAALSDRAAASLSEYGGSLRLDGLTALSDDAAVCLGRHRGTSLSLDGLVEISDKAAAALAEYPGGLHLDGIVSLSAEQARLLRARKSAPSLRRWRTDTAPQLTTLTVAQAELLLAELHSARTSHGEPLCLGIQKLTADVAKVLAAYPGPLQLDGLTALTAEQAQPLMERKPAGPRDAPSLSLGMENLSPDVANVLATYPGPLRLDRLTALTVEQAQPLMDRKPAGAMDVPSLSLGIETLTPDVAKVLATYPGPLQLDGLADMPVDAEIALARHGRLSCRGLTSLKSGQLAAVLDYHRSPQSENLTDVSPEAAMVLADAGYDLMLNGLVSLRPEVARALARNKVGWLKKAGFDSPEEARPRVGRIVGTNRHVRIPVADSSAWFCDLSLDGLTEVDPETAAALASYGDGTLSLNGLADLTPEVARALAQHGGRLSLLGLKTLPADAARELARHRGGMSLGLETLSDESGKVIAGAAGLLLPRLAEVTPGALAAIKARPGLRMPRALYTPLERFFWYFTGPMLYVVLGLVAVIAASLAIGVVLTRRLADLDTSSLPTHARFKTASVPTIIATSVFVGLMTFLLIKYLPRQAGFHRELGAVFSWADYAGFDLLLCGLAAGIALSGTYWFSTLVRRSVLLRRPVRPLWTMKPHLRRRDRVLAGLAGLYALLVVFMLFSFSGQVLPTVERFPMDLFSARLALFAVHLVLWLFSVYLVWFGLKLVHANPPYAPPRWLAIAEGIVGASRWEAIEIPWSAFASYAWKADYLELKRPGRTSRDTVMRFAVPPDQREVAHAFLSAHMPGEGVPSAS